VRIKSLRSDVRFVRPNDGPRLYICAELPKVLPVTERLKYPSIVEEVGQVNFSDQTVLEPNAD